MALIDAKSAQLSSTPPTRTCNDSAYGSGVGATGLVTSSNATTTGRKNEGKTSDGATLSRNAGTVGKDDEDDDISDVVVHDDEDDADFYYGMNDEEDADEDIEDSSEHYDPLLIKSAGVLYQMFQVATGFAMHYN